MIVVDTSGSMRGDLKRIVSTLGALPEAFAQAGVDYRVAIVRFGTGHFRDGPDYPEVWLDFTSDGDTFRAALSTLQTRTTGPTESGTEALELALSLLRRPNAIPVILLFTDEDDDLPVTVERGSKREPPGRKWLTSPRSPQFQARLDQTAQALIARQTRLVMLMNRRNKPAEFQYGSPRATLLNAQNNLDIPATLALLTSMQMHRSLQGQLLASGICSAGTCTQGRVGNACAVNEDCGLPSRAYDIRLGRKRSRDAFFQALRDEIVTSGDCEP
jgi:hypothetical protein